MRLETLIIAGLLGAGGIAVGLVIGERRRAGDRRAANRHRRYEVPETDDRIPIIDRSDDEGRADRQRAREELAAYAHESGDPDGQTPGESVASGGQDNGARVVMTPDGEMTLTRPPFKRRERLLTGRRARFGDALSRRLPPWLMLCPKVRMDGLVEPLGLDGRDAADWARWRRRVRFRSVDLVIVDRRTWHPILVLLFGHTSDARVGRDRLVTEVLEQAEIPYVFVRGRLTEDWPLIRPHMEDAMLDHPMADRDRPAGWDASAAVALLRLDDEQFGLE